MTLSVPHTSIQAFYKYVILTLLFFVLGEIVKIPFMGTLNKIFASDVFVLA
jgi:hypothetical protein